MIGALGGAGCRDNFQVEGIAGGRKSMPSPAASGSAAKASPAAVGGQGSSVLDPGVSMVAAVAKIPFDRDTRDGAGMASQGMESLLALAFETSATIGTTTNSAEINGAHSSHGD